MARASSSGDASALKSCDGGTEDSRVGSMRGWALEMFKQQMAWRAEMSDPQT